MHDPLGEFVGATYYCLAIQPNEQNVLNQSLNSLSLGQTVYVINGNQRMVLPRPSPAG